MGKAALIIVVGFLIAMVGTKKTDIRTELITVDEQSFYQEKTLARARAQSALNITVANLQNEFDEYREHVDLDENGEYAISVIELEDDLVSISATGFAGRAQYQIVGEMVRTGTALFSALTIDGPLSDASGIGGEYQISGMDTMPDDADGVHTGGNANTHGIHTTWTDSDAEAQDGFRPELVTGISGESDFITGPTELDLDKITQDILTHPACIAGVPPCYVFNENQRWTGSDTFGTPEEPAIVIVHGDAVMRGAVQGHGILYVTGDFKTEVGQPHWQGMVYASGTGANHELRGEPRIDGAIIFRATDETGDPGSPEDPPLPMTVTIRGNVSLNYSSYTLANMTSLIPGLDAGTPLITLENVRSEMKATPEKADI